MVLIGVISGEYQGNKYYRLIFTEKLDRAGCYGDNAISSRCTRDCFEKARSDIDLFLGNKVIANYDRFGKVQDINLM